MLNNCNLLYIKPKKSYRCVCLGQTDYHLPGYRVDDTWLGDTNYNKCECIMYTYTFIIVKHDSNSHIKNREHNINTFLTSLSFYRTVVTATNKKVILLITMLLEKGQFLLKPIRVVLIFFFYLTYYRDHSLY